MRDSLHEHEEQHRSERPENAMLDSRPVFQAPECQWLHTSLWSFEQKATATSSTSWVLSTLATNHAAGSTAKFAGVFTASETVL